MSEISNEYKLECYQKVMSIGMNNNIWIAEDTVSKKRFVMRKLPIAMEPVYKKLSDIHHPNIVEIIDVFIYDGFLYIIEEYLKAKPLSDVIEAQKMPRRRVLSVGRQLLSALAVLHENNIIHRDIKPENIMMDEQGNVKLIDFDIARIFSEDKSRDTKIKGSRNYASPEQFGFAQSDGRADIYALGVTLNELATRKLPEDKMCSGILGIIIKRCIRFDPKKRYQSAAQALKHINTLSMMVKIMIFAIIISALILFAAAIKPAQLSEQAVPEESSSRLKTPEYRNRIISVDMEYEEQYPALLMSEDKEYEFYTELGENIAIEASAEKTGGHMTLTCGLSTGDAAVFNFDDVFFKTYIEQGYYNNIELEKTSPEYEILLDDLNADGINDLLITLAWRRSVNTPDPADFYYLTEYSTLWVVYMSPEQELTCSEPLYFNGSRPKLENRELIFDDSEQTYITFKNGTWVQN